MTLLLWFFTQPVRTSAQELIDLPNTPVTNDFNVGPTKTKLILDPGEQVDTLIHITNRLGKSTNFHLEVEDFVPQADATKYTQFLGPNKSQFSSRDWFSSIINNFTLQHGQKISIPIRVKVPTDAEPGDHYSAVFVKTKDNTESSTSINLSSRVGILYLISINGDINKAGSLIHFLASQSLYLTPEVIFSLKYQNTGNIHLSPTGKIAVSNLLTQNTREFPITDWVILRESTRVKELSWSAPHVISFYKATLSLDDGLPGDDIQSTVYFTVLPVLDILIIILTILSLALATKYFIAKYEIRKKR